MRIERVSRSSVSSAGPLAIVHVDGMQRLEADVNQVIAVQMVCTSLPSQYILSPISWLAFLGAARPARLGLQREMELLVEAGMTPMEMIVAATSEKNQTGS